MPSVYFHRKLYTMERKTLKFIFLFGNFRENIKIIKIINQKCSAVVSILTVDTPNISFFFCICCFNSTCTIIFSPPLITFANSLDPGQDQQSVGPDLNP